MRVLLQRVQPQCYFVPLRALKMFHKEQLMHCKIFAAIAMEISNCQPIGPLKRKCPLRRNQNIPNESWIITFY